MPLWGTDHIIATIAELSWNNVPVNMYTHATVTQTQHTSIQCTLLCAMSITRRVDQHAAFAYNLLANSYIIIMEKASCSNAPCIVSLIPIKQNKLKNMGKLKNNTTKPDLPR